MSRKSLLYLAVYDPHVPLTGTGARGAEFVNNLAERFDLDLVYMDGSGHPPIPELSKTYASRLKGVRSKTRIEFKPFDYFVFSRSLYREADGLFGRNKYDFIICDYGLSAVYGLLLSEKYGVPLVYLSHNVEYQVYRQKGRTDRRRLVLLPYVYYAEKRAVEKSSILVAITGSDAEHYARWIDPSKMLVIPQGFDDSVFNPFYRAPSNDPKVVLFCGNFNIQFNRDVVNTVMNRILGPVLAERPNTIFRFVGANPPRGIQHPKVEFTGFVEDYPAYLKNADLVITPMLHGGGFPTKVVEALACGKTTIATPIGARALEKDYRNLRVLDVDRFPEAVVRELKDGSPVSADDFEKLKDRYSWRDIIGKLADRLDRTGSERLETGKGNMEIRTAGDLETCGE